MALFEGARKLFSQSLSAVAEIFDGVQTEVLVFIIAIVSHTIVFGKHKFKVSRSTGKVAKASTQRRPPCSLKSNSNAALQNLKASISSSNLDEALKSLRTVAKFLKSSAGSTPSIAPRPIMRQLLRLAKEQDRITPLLDELCGCDLLGGWVPGALLEEASKLGSSEAIEMLVECFAASGVQLNVATHCALIRGARGAAAVSRAVTDALQQHGDDEEVISAAFDIASTRTDKSLAALAFARLPPKPGAELGAAAVRLVAMGLVKGQSVLQLFEERLVGVDLCNDTRAVRLVADAVLKARRTDLLRELLAACASGARLVTLLRSYGSEGRLKEAQEVFKASPERTTCLYNALLDVYIDAREMFAAERVMMLASRTRVADVVTYSTVIKAHLRGGDIQRARCAIEAMRSAGFAPNCVTFNELIDSAFKNDPQAVWGLVDEMMACGLKPNQVTCSILLKNVRQDTSPTDVQRTLAMLDDMSEETDEVLLSSICEACVRSGQRDLLSLQLRRLCGEGAVIVRGAHTFGSVIRAYGFVKDLEGVWATWRDMRRRHIVPTSITLGCMVEALVSNDGPEAGYLMVTEMLESTTTRGLVNAVIYCSVLKGFAHQKCFDRVWQIYGEMQADMKALNFSVATYNLLIDACARSCDMARVPGLLREMSSLMIEPNVITFSTIVKGYVQEHQLDKAFELLADMKRVNKFKPDEITYNTLLDGCARQGLYERGVAMLQEMQDDGVAPSNFTLSVLVKLATRSHHNNKAFELCTEISKKYKFKLNMHVYNNLLNACIQNRDNEGAMNLFVQSLKERVRPDARTYTLLLRAMLSHGDIRSAAGLLRAAHGLDGAHRSLAGFDKGLLQVRGGLTSDVMLETLEVIARFESDRSFTASLVGELRRLPSVKIDSRLVLRLTA